MTRNMQQQTLQPASLSELARHLLLAREEVRRLVAERVLERRSDGRFDLDGARHGYIKYLRDRRSTWGGADAELRRARAREIELRTAERAHNLIEIDEAISALDTILGAIISELAGLPAAASRDLRLRRHLENLIHDIRQRAAERLGAEVNSLRQSGAARDTVPPGQQP